MKILFTIFSLETGGAQTFMIRLANEIAKNHQVFIFDHNPHRYHKEMLENILPSIKVFSYQPKGLYKWIVWKINAFLGIFYKNNNFYEEQKEKYYIKILRKINPDIVNSHSQYGDECFARNNLSYPFIISMHGEYEMLLAKKIPFNFQNILKKSQAIIIASEKNRESIDLCDNRNELYVQKIYYGFPDITFTHQNRSLITDNVNALIFGLVARDIPEKGWVEAIQAFENIQTKYPEKEIYLLLMGGGKFIDELKHKYFYNKHIIFTGLLKKPIEWISIIDVGLMPSYFMGESLPNAIIEYLYCGKAVITTDIGDTHQMIDSEKGKAGIVVPLNMPHSPAIKHLSEAMLQYVINKGLLIEHQGRAKNAFQKFSMSTCVQKYQSLYDSIVKEK